MENKLVFVGDSLDNFDKSTFFFGLLIFILPSKYLLTTLPKSLSKKALLAAEKEKTLALQEVISSLGKAIRDQRERRMTSPESNYAPLVNSTSVQEANEDEQDLSRRDKKEWRNKENCR